MSTVVGTCTDCIVSLPVQPKTSLRYKVLVTEGQNLIIKTLGTVIGYYPSDNLASTSVTLAPGSIWTSPPNVSSLCVGTDQPLQVTLVSSTISQTLNVNSALIVDDTYSSVTIQNPSSATQNACVTIYYTQ